VTRPVRAVVFAYHDVGVRCLKTLLSGGVQVPLVVTVADDPHETQWFASVAETARDYGLAVVTPDNPNTPEFAARLAALEPDFLFSFYYRALLGAALLECARRGALNMHGSLLPRYRGRAPVNWAIVNGERETGATLHHMVARADAGDIVDQQAVPILEDDEASEVYTKVTVAAEIVLERSLPGLIAGRAPRRAQPIVPGQYFGRRRPEDGRIDWHWPARRIHDLVRAVAPPFPGAFGEVAGQRWSVLRTRVAPYTLAPGPARLIGAAGECHLACADGSVLRILRAANAAGALELGPLARELERRPLPLG
jgi:methionyl-tRNA formyltransferase